MLRKSLSLLLLLVGIAYRLMAFAIGIALLPDNLAQIWEEYLAELSNVAWVVLVLGGGSTIYIFWPSLADRIFHRRDGSMSNGDRSIINNASNYGQQITGDVTFNVSNGYAKLTETEIDSLATNLSRFSSVDVRVIGNENCQAIGDATVEKLISLGVNVRGLGRIGMQSPEPVRPYAVSVSADKTSATLTIAPKAY